MINLRNSNFIKFLSFSIALFYLILAIGLIIFVVNYGFTDWEEVSANLDKTMENTLNAVRCEIDYNGFHYKGICSDKEEIFNFMENITKVE